MKFTTLLSASFIALALAIHAVGADSTGNGSPAVTAPGGGGSDHGSGKKVSVTGEAKCAKCILHEGDTCRTVIQTKEDGKVVTYYVVRNKVAENFSTDVCTAPHMVKATGTVKDVDGKHQLTLAKISVDEK